MVHIVFVSEIGISTREEVYGIMKIHLWGNNMFIALVRLSDAIQRKRSILFYSQQRGTVIIKTTKWQIIFWSDRKVGDYIVILINKSHLFIVRILTIHQPVSVYCIHNEILYLSIISYNCRCRSCGWNGCTDKINIGVNSKINIKMINHPVQ